MIAVAANGGAHARALVMLLIVTGLFVLNVVTVTIISDGFSAQMATISLLLAAGIVGFAVAIVLFVGVDDDLQAIKTILIGTFSGVTLLKGERIIASVRMHFAELAVNTQASTRFFGALTALILGLSAGFFFARFWLQYRIAQARTDLSRLLAGAPELSPLPWPELRQDFTRLQNVPDGADVDKLADRTNWDGVAPADAIKAGAVLVYRGRFAAALAPLRAALASAEPPSPVAFDLYCTALVECYARPANNVLPEDSVRAFRRELARMATFLPHSFLVNLDAGYVYLYTRDQIRWSIEYSRRALEVRPDSPRANLNLACGLAATVDPATATSQQIDEITAALDVYLTRYGSGCDFNEEGDFDRLRANPRFAAWLAAHGIA